MMTTLATDDAQPWYLRLLRALAPSAYAAVALPLALLGLFAPAVVGRWQSRLAERLLGVPVPDTPLAAGRVRRHSVVSLPVSLVAFVIVVPIWLVFLARGVLYPVFGADNLEDSWGGPTLAGAWFVHFIQGPVLVALAAFLLRPFSRLQARLAGKYLSGDAQRA